jgi:RING-box protein 1
MSDEVDQVEEKMLEPGSGDSTPGSKKIDPLEAAKIAERRRLAKEKAKALEAKKQQSKDDFKLLKGQKRYELLKWNAICMWAYGDEGRVETHCAICRSELHDMCLDCQANNYTLESSGCKVSWGFCNHSYHYHCIIKYLKLNPHCPLCNKEFDFKNTN